MPKPLVFALTSLATGMAVSLWGWSLDPYRFADEAIMALCLPALWAFSELVQPGDRGETRGAIVRWHRLCITWAGLMLACTVGFQIAIGAKILQPEWAPVLARIGGFVVGASMMLWGNYLPKLSSPWSLANQPFDWQRVHRFVGWGASVGGLAIISIWLTMPPEEARSATAVVVTVVSILAVGRKLHSLGDPGHGRRTSVR